MTPDSSSVISQTHWIVSGFDADIAKSGWIGFDRFRYCFDQSFETMKGSQFENLFEKIIRVLENRRPNTEFDGVVFWIHDTTCVFQYTHKLKPCVFVSVIPATARIHRIPSELTNNHHMQYHVASIGETTTKIHSTISNYVRQYISDNKEVEFLSSLANRDWKKQSAIAIGEWYLTVDGLLPVVFSTTMPVATPCKTIHLQTNIFSGPESMIDYVIRSIKAEMIIRSDWTETTFEELRTRMKRDICLVWDSCTIRLTPGNLHIDGYLTSGNIPEQDKTVPIEELLSPEETPAAAEEPSQSKTIDINSQYISPVLLDALGIVKKAMNSHPDARKLIQSYLSQ